MIAIGLLGGLLVSTLLAWLAIRFLVARPTLWATRRGWFLLALGAFNALNFLAAFVVVKSCAEYFAMSSRATPDGEERNVRPGSTIAKAGINSQEVPMLASWNTQAVDPAEQSESEAERQDRYRGYHAGYVLATNPQHQGSRVPQTWVLDAIVNLRSKGQGPGFSAGFRQGYLTGLASREVDRPK